MEHDTAAIQGLGTSGLAIRCRSQGRKTKIEEVGEEEKVALLAMLRVMLAFRPEERPTATAVMECQWMRKWALPTLPTQMKG
jgi:hypothetical protein